MFKYDIVPGQMVRVSLENRSVMLPGGMNLAAALLGAGEIISRVSPTSKKPCSPHCLMGVCHECLMEIDGINRQACMTTVTQGMVIKRNFETTDPVFSDKGGTP